MMKNLCKYRYIYNRNYTFQRNKTITDSSNPENLLKVNQSFSEEVGIIEKENKQNSKNISQTNIIEYRPKYFKKIRKHYKITKIQLLHSLNPNLNKSNIFKIGEGEGASGSFFFFSFDRKFIIKTISRDEVNIFLKFIKEYTHQITDHSSIITIILGVYTLKIQGLIPVHLLIMTNSLPEIQNYVRIYIYIYRS